MTKTELELEALRARIAALEAQKEAEDAARATDTENVRQLAVALHVQLCPLNHSPTECTWNEASYPNHPVNGDWTETQHQVWLNRARLGIAKMREIGFTVIDPDEP